MLYQSFDQIKSDLAASKISVEKLVNHYLSQIELKNSELNAFLEVYADEAKQ